MGQGNSKKKEKKDDQCIGNRKVRTIIIAALLMVYIAMAAPYVFDQQEFWSDLEDNNILGWDFVTDMYNSWCIIITGVVLIFVFAICAILLFFIPGCDNTLGRVAGFGLIVGGVIYIIGWTYYISTYSDAVDCSLCDDETQQRIDAQFTAWWGEQLLAAGTAILLGVDALLHFFDGESGRLVTNLSLLCVVAVLCAPTYYMQSGDDDSVSLQSGNDGVELIATGYAVIFWTALVYIILYILTCCTCDCKDNCLVRLIIAIALVVGGLMTAIGYYVYVGGYEDADGDDAAGKWVTMYIGYTILIGGLCIVWALDMAFDDFKNR